jgi:cytochrome c oxidase assembly protein subunit 11
LPNPDPARRNNRLIAGGAIAAILLMLGLSFASVPLYKLFCAVTGYGGTPQLGGPAAGRAEAGAAHIVVRFNADVDGALPWRFVPAQRQIELPLGQEQIAFYTARNPSAQAQTGMALYNVTPDKVGRYFHKTACFCFNQQTLGPGQEMQFPVSFHVDPAIATDPATRDVRVITLSYTFFRSLADAEKSGALAKAGPHVGPLRTAPATAAASAP